VIPIVSLGDVAGVMVVLGVVMVAEVVCWVDEVGVHWGSMEFYYNYFLGCGVWGMGNNKF
jgi:uncharacterized membrane protein